MDYYFLEFQYPRTGFISGGVTFNPELETNYMAIKDPLPAGTKAEVTLTSSVRKLDADLFNTTTSALVISGEFKSILEKRKVGVQFIPALVYYHDGRPVEQEYWVAHLLDEVDCLDYERSDYGRKKVIAASVLQPPRIIAKVIHKVCLDPSKIEEHEFFILKYTYISNPIISADLYEECRKAKLKLHVTPI